MPAQITIRNARLHNLKNITLSLPKERLIVFTGLSGSGKSTLAFDILHKEGQRQYMESLGVVTWGLSKPPVDSIVGLSPSISVDQFLTNHSPRSTVGTATEIFTYLRVLYARLGHRPCPKCGKDVPPPIYESSAGDWQDESDESLDGTFLCPHCGAEVPEMGMANFSFNKPAGACPTCTGLGVVRQAIVGRLIDESKSIPENAVDGWIEFHITRNSQILKSAGKYFGFEFDPSKATKEYTPIQRDLLYVWLIDVGVTTIKQGLRHCIDRHDRRDFSLFRIGRSYIKRCLKSDLPPPNAFLPPYQWKLSGG